MQVRFISERQGTFVTAFAVARGSKLIAVAETDEKTITVGAGFILACDCKHWVIDGSKYCSIKHTCVHLQVTPVLLQTGQRQEAVELPGRVSGLTFR